MDYVLQMMLLANLLKPSTSISELLARVARVFFGQHAERLAMDLRSGALPAPTTDMLRRSRQKLDLMNILYQRTYNKTVFNVRYYLAASGRNSPGAQAW